MIVTHQARWLQAMNELILPFQLPIEIGLLVPPTVKPDRTNLSIVG